MSYAVTAPLGGERGYKPVDDDDRGYLPVDEVDPTDRGYQPLQPYPPSKTEEAKVGIGLHVLIALGAAGAVGYYYFVRRRG